MFDINTIVRPNILALQPYSSARDEYTGKQGIFLDANENPYGELNRYPDPHQSALKDRIALVYSTAPENIFIGNGSDEAIDLCMRIFCEPEKDKALTFTPTYGMYKVSASINNIELLEVPLNAEFQLDIYSAIASLKDPAIKILFICSPNNPSGNTIEEIESIIKNFKGIVVVDEAYADFTNNSLLEKLGMYPNLIILKTLSKAWGLAAVRLGMAFGSKAIIDIFNKVKPPYNISTLNYKAAIEKLEDIQGFEKAKSLLISERERMAEALAKLPQVVKVYPSQTNFLLIEVRNANRIYDYLKQNNIIVRNRNQVVPNCIRISVGTPDENQKLLTALENSTI